MPKIGSPQKPKSRKSKNQHSALTRRFFFKGSSCILHIALTAILKAYTRQVHQGWVTYSGVVIRPVTLFFGLTGSTNATLPHIEIGKAVTQVKERVMDNYTDFLSYMVERNYSPTTISDYGNTYRRFFKECKLRLTTNEIKTFVANHQPRTKLKYIHQMKSICKFFKVAIDWERSIPDPKFKKKSPLTVSFDDEKRMLRFIRMDLGQKKYASILLLLIHTGLRIGELKLIGPDSLFSIEDKNGKPKPLLRIDPTGSHSDEGRYVPLDKIAKEQLDFLGLPIDFDRRTFSRIVQQARTRLSLQPYTIHTMRKTFMTRSLARGVNVIDLANIMGHKNTNTMLEYAGKDAMTLSEAFHA
jgi:integrase